jgi:hypothetical protein
MKDKNDKQITLKGVLSWEREGKRRKKENIVNVLSI